MKIRSTEQFIDFLDREWSKRRWELTFLSGQVSIRNRPKSEEEFWIRTGFVVLYAHWEGFVKAIATAYLNFVFYRRLKYDEMSDNILATAIRSKLSDAARTNHPSAWIELVAFFRNAAGQRGTLSWQDSINTKGNLRSEVFKDVVDICGLDYTEFEPFEVQIDRGLADRRNGVAHGRDILASIGDFEDVYRDITQIMTRLRALLQNSVIRKDYQRIEGA